MLKSISVGLSLAVLLGCFTTKIKAPTVTRLDISKYCGVWHEWARLPNSFERGLTDVTAEYQLLPDGGISVKNTGTNSQGKRKTISGFAKVPNPNEPGKLRITFRKPFSGKYYVYAIDSGYNMAVVGSPSGKFLWLLGKHDRPLASEIEFLEGAAVRVGFDTTGLMRSY